MHMHAQVTASSWEMYNKPNSETNHPYNRDGSFLNKPKMLKEVCSYQKTIAPFVETLNH